MNFSLLKQVCTEFQPYVSHPGFGEGLEDAMSCQLENPYWPKSIAARAYDYGVEAWIRYLQAVELRQEAG
jgi:hypothetical protein